MRTDGSAFVFLPFVGPAGVGEVARGAGPRWQLRFTLGRGYNVTGRSWSGMQRIGGIGRRGSSLKRRRRRGEDGGALTDRARVPLVGVVGRAPVGASAGHTPGPTARPRQGLALVDEREKREEERCGSGERVRGKGPAAALFRQGRLHGAHLQELKTQHLPFTLGLSLPHSCLGAHVFVATLLVRGIGGRDTRWRDS